MERRHEEPRGGTYHISAVLVPEMLENNKRFVAVFHISEELSHEFHGHRTVPPENRQEELEEDDGII